MSFRRRHFLLRRVVLGLAVAAFVAPTALAHHLPGGHVPQATSPDAVDRFLRNNPGGYVRAIVPDAVDRFLRNNPNGIGTTPDVVAPVERFVIVGPGAADTPLAAKGDGFDYGDASVGVGLAAALALLVGLAAIGMRGHGRILTGH